MPSDPSPTARVTFPPRAWLALGLFALLMVGSLVTQIVLLEDQRTTVDRQLAVAAKQLDTVEPLIRDVAPLVERTNAGLPRAQRLTREALPLVEELDRARVGEQLEATGALARSLLDADAPRALARVPQLASDVGRLTDELLAQNRARRLLIRANSVLGEMRALHAVPKLTDAAELAPVQLRILAESRDIQAQTLAIQREAIAQIRALRTIGEDLRTIGRDTLAQARRAADSAQSLDRKTGGSLTTPPAG